MFILSGISSRLAMTLSNCGATAKGGFEDGEMGRRGDSECGSAAFSKFRFAASSPSLTVALSLPGSNPASPTLPGYDTRHTGEMATV